MFTIHVYSKVSVYNACLVVIFTYSIAHMSVGIVDH